MTTVLLKKLFMMILMMIQEELEMLPTRTLINRYPLKIMDKKDQLLIKERLELSSLKIEILDLRYMFIMLILIQLQTMLLMSLDVVVQF